MTLPRGPSLDRVAVIATELGELNDEVVFIGGAIAPLLQTDPPFPRARLTTDVDGVIATSSYSESHDFEDALIRRGFRPDLSDPTHAHRWRSPSDVPFDLVPAGDHLGGTGNPWDQLAIKTAVKVTLSQGVTIHHATAASFIAQKWAAHSDRGKRDAFVSRDLEDILALLASRPSIVDEVSESSTEVREYISQQSSGILRDAYLEDLLAAHLNNAQDPVAVAARVRTTLERLSSIR